MSDFKAIVGNGEGYNGVELHPEYKFVQQFGILNLDFNNGFTMETGTSEFGLVLLGGTCDIEVEGKNYGEIKSRANVFSGVPTAVYVPADSQFSIVGKAEIAVCSGKCEQKTESALITPEQIKIMKVGRENWSREVRIIIGPDSPCVNMLLGETINPPGNWSGIPPAKHEKNNLPEESFHEELYYFKTDKPQGWGMERIYSPERGLSELLYVEENVVTFMPWGYHQIVAAPGYTLYYLFFLAGEGKNLAQHEDPEHKWIKNP